MAKPTIKTKEELMIMKDGGSRLGVIKKALFDKVAVGINAADIENLACKLIASEGGVPSFKEVPGYSWATCVNVNDGVVHGIPKKSLIFREGDLVSVDIGMIYKGFHTDTSFTKLLGEDKELIKFLDTGKRALKSAIKAAKPGRYIGDISKAFETELKKDNLTPIKSLTGHGIGRKLHESPLIPCFAGGSSDEKIKIVEGMALALEIMYTNGGGEIKTDSDGWTIRTRDGKIAALFEETVGIMKDGPIVFTKP